MECVQNYADKPEESYLDQMEEHCQKSSEGMWISTGSFSYYLAISRIKTIPKSLWTPDIRERIVVCYQGGSRGGVEGDLEAF